jgi:TolB protein
VAVSGPRGADATDLTPWTGEQIGPAWAPDGRQLLYQQSPTGGTDYQLWVIQADGSQPRQLTHGVARSFGGSWSPNGRLIAFLRQTASRCDVWLMRRDGVNAHDLTSHSRGDNCGGWESQGKTGPDWSPDGKRIIFSSNRNGEFELYTMDVHGSHVVQLTHKGSYNTSPSWSPDGKLIAFESDRQGSASIYTMWADGTHVRRITYPPSGYDSQPAWQPLPSTAPEPRPRQRLVGDDVSGGSDGTLPWSFTRVTEPGGHTCSVFPTAQSHLMRFV